MNKSKIVPLGFLLNKTKVGSQQYFVLPPCHENREYLIKKRTFHNIVLA